MHGPHPLTGDGRVTAGDIVYKPGWSFKQAGPLGRYLCIFATTPDSTNPTRTRVTQHQFEIPDGGMTARWVFDRLLLCELHETGEFFEVAGRRPFYPNHGDEGSPYELVTRPYEQD